ncbi:M43 family zinc metalloprotease [Hymenobacter metallilatus]|uniref:T9SS C-terminal target domain-containing protein n=1 Tax=Hymenobacter metallilatus TaxID=2493666 RepID=A0A428JK34_9BACT|nr:M43 family zinc metalloprotease [Hymenobacter metallilatus]RSK33143.1 T9SS C-terminal target domain-containing protein [Hymenobacter metallilatus]
MLKTLLVLATLAVSLLRGPAAEAQPTLRPTPDPHPLHRTGYRCAFDSAQQAEFARNPAAEREYRAFMQAVGSMSSTDRARLLAQPDVTVPVVVHIIHTGGANNITDAQVQDAIRILNQDFSKTNPDTADVIRDFQPIYANVGFRFRLARLDPNGNCTTGITRTYSAQTSVGDNTVKNLIRWDPSRYLNIWVSDNANGAGGYAYLPCPSATLDGIVVRNAQFGGVGRSCGSNFCRRTLTHEVGHYFGLPHTWGNSNSVGLPSNCNIDDGIADTPNTSGSNQDCNLNYAPCGVLANVQNYMDYASCSRMFTEGQKAVMRASLTRTCRSTLVSATNLRTTGTNDGYSAPACAPIIAFRPSVQAVCEGSTVTFTDYSYNFTYNAATTQYSWSFPGGLPATSTARTPTVTYPTAGIYSVTLTITTPDGSSSQTQPNLIQVAGASAGLQAPVAESFENAGFPENEAAPSLRNWLISSSNNSFYKWERQTGSVASNGAAYLVVRTPVIASGTVSTLISPNINLAAVPAGVQVFFDRAYGVRSGVETDQLQVAYSINCGSTWVPLITYTAGQLNTQGNQRFGGYAPDSLSDWRLLAVPLPGSVQGSPRLQLRFQLTSGGGNNFYLDNVRVGTSAVTAIRPADPAQHQISVAPNPLTAQTTVQFTLAAAATVQLRVLDVLGREVHRLSERRYAPGTFTLPLAGATQLPAGVYVVQLIVGQQPYSLRVVVPE